MAEVPRVGPQATGLVSARYRRGPGRLRGLGQPLAGRRQGLRPRGAPGATRAGGPAEAHPAQRQSIPEFLWHGPEAYGFRGRVWTRARVAKVIEWEFGVRYHKGHVGRLLKELGWTPQQPIKRAIQRDEAAIQRWRDETWPELRRRGRRRGPGPGFL